MNRLIAVLILLSALGAQAAKFPLKASSDGRYIVDQNNQPFFIQGMAAWHTLVNVPSETATNIFDRLATNGFNAIQCRLIDDYFQGDSFDNNNSPPLDYYGIRPFDSGYSFDKVNTNYFARQKRLIDYAASKGFVLLCAPCYLGYATTPSQGFYEEVQTNTLAAMTNYGRFVGNYFKDCTNVIWMMNGDHSPPSLATNAMYAIAAGIIAEDTSKLITEHVSGRSRVYDTYDHSWWLTLEALYQPRAYVEALAAWQESTVLPIYHTEAPYKGDGANPTDTQMRKYMWNGVTFGALGGSFMGDHYFCEGRSNSTAGKYWTEYYFETAAQQMPYVHRYFTNRNWFLLQPDSNNMVAQSADKGTWNTEEYITVSRASNGSFIVAYFGKTDAPTLTISNAWLSSPSNSGTARWYDPRNGSNHVIGIVSNTVASQDFTPPSAEDWVLTIDADSGFTPPDEPAPPATTNYYRAYMSGKIEMSGKAVLQ